jgi:cytochrome c oxidase assembly protein subunit 11
MLKPSIAKIKVYPGDTALTFYLAHNLSSETITGIATYNIMPAKAGVYFNKIQCFCFEEQRLKGNEYVELPVLFFIDLDFLNDPKMKDIDSLTLSYTFFKTTD